MESIRKATLSCLLLGYWLAVVAVPLGTLYNLSAAPRQEESSTPDSQASSDDVPRVSLAELSGFPLGGGVNVIY